MQNPRCVIWEAVSSKKQAKEISPHEQRRINLEHMARHNGVLIADLEVPGHTRDYDLLEEARADIDAYQTLFDLVRAKAFDVLICLNRSRLGRTLALIEAIAAICRREGILIYETTSPPGSLAPAQDSYAELVTGAFRSASAQHEVEELKRRQKMGMEGRFKKGEFLSGVPWGWKAIYDDRGKATAVLDDIASKTIRMALVTLYCEQAIGTYAIADELNRLGMVTPAGTSWTHKDVNNLFRMLWRFAGYSEINHYSRGHKRPYARQKGNWPPIITEEELHRILQERQARRGKRGVGNATTYRFALMVYCHYCKTRMWHTYNHTQAGNRYIFATCAKGDHPLRNLTALIIMEKVREFFVMMQNPDNWPAFLDKATISTEEIDRKEKEIAAQIKQSEDAILKADDMLFAQRLDDARHARQVRNLKDKILQLQHELTILTDRRAMIDHASHRLDRIREIAERGMEYLDMPDERAANALLRPLIRIWAKDGKCHRIDIL